ncbi:MAG: TIGR02597 family protein [Verrucomicrobiota bacterium]
MKKLLPLLLGAAAIFAHSALAQNATTTPVGAMTYTLNATTGGLTNTYISIPLTDSPVFSGAVQSFGATTLTFSGTPFVAGALAQSGTPYFLRFQSGLQAGRTVLITANTANTVTVDVTNNSGQATNHDAPGFAVVANDTAQIFQGDTLASFFGNAVDVNGYLTGVALKGAAGALQADTVSIYNRSTVKLDSYFFSTALGYWRSSASTVNQNAVILYPDTSFGVTRRSGRPAISFTVLGDVPAVAPKIKTAGNNQPVYGANPFPLDMTLGTLNLINWTKSNSALSADTINIYNAPLARMDTYYQKLDGTWRKSGDAITDKSSFAIPAGSFVGYLKRGAVAGATSFVSSPLPYTP